MVCSTKPNITPRTPHVNPCSLTHHRDAKLAATRTTKCHRIGRGSPKAPFRSLHVSSRQCIVQVTNCQNYHALKCSINYSHPHEHVKQFDCQPPREEDLYVESTHVRFLYHDCSGVRRGSQGSPGHARRDATVHTPTPACLAAFLLTQPHTYGRSVRGSQTRTRARIGGIAT